jgi:hypothetical protein
MSKEVYFFIKELLIKKIYFVDLSKADESFPDIYCMVPFYNDDKILGEIHNSILF